MVDIHGIPWHFPEFVDIAVEFGHHETGCFEGVNIAVYGPVGHIQLLRQFVNRIIHIA